MSTIEAKGRKYTLEILKKVNNICLEKNIPYTLLFETLMSQDKEKKYAEWLGNITIGLLYPDYLRLQRAIKEEKDIYILSRDTNENYNAHYSQICMKSRVILPSNRKADQPYYDYSIWVYPIFFAGNTKQEYEKNKRRFQYYNCCMQALAPIPFTRGLKAKIESVKKKIWYNRRKNKENEIKDFFSEFLEKAQIPSKYVLIPCKNPLSGFCCLSDTYRDLERCQFDNLEVSCIRKKQEWINSYYNHSEQNMITCRPANRALVDGPETIRRVQLVALENLCEFDRICRKHKIPYILAAGTLLGAIRHKGFIPWDDDIDVSMLDEDWIYFSKIIAEELDKERFFLRTQETDEDNNLVFYQIKRNGTMYVKGGRDEFNTHRGIALDILPYHNSPNSRILFLLQDKICHFLKTMTWAHMGHTDEKRPYYKRYYSLLAKVSNKTSSQLYYKLANIVKKKSPYLAYLCVKRNPFHKGFNQRKFFENVCYVEFEGHMFPAPKEYEEFLIHCYGEDYMKLLTPLGRINRHLPAKIELNGLYDYDKEEE